MPQVAFLLGAGSSIDAVIEAGKPEEYRYPLVADLAKLCFGRNGLAPGNSIEDLFQDAIERGNAEPLDKLCERIFDAASILPTALLLRFSCASRTARHDSPWQVPPG